MLTDWTVVDPHYFYMRGVLLGVVASIFVVAVLIKIIDGVNK